MATATQRIPVLVTATEKKVIAKKAAAAGVSMGEYLRQAAKAFSGSTDEVDEAALLRLVETVERGSVEAIAAIEDTVAFCEASNRRIAAMEAAAAARRKER